MAIGPNGATENRQGWSEALPAEPLDAVIVEYEFVRHRPEGAAVSAVPSGLRESSLKDVEPTGSARNASLHPWRFSLAPLGPKARDRFLLSLVLCSVSLWLVPVHAGDAKNDSKALLNGKDLSGWKAFGRATKDGPTTEDDAKGAWSLADGILKCTGKPTGFLITEKEYQNYILTLKWRYPNDLKAGNSGVLIHCQKENKVWPVCLEVQLRSSRAGDLWLQTAAEVKLTVDASRRDADDKTMRHIWRNPKDENIEKPFGEWNDYEITCKGGSITVAVNGKIVNEGKDCNLTKGRIGLQAEGTEIHFKDIMIRKLTE